MWLGTRREPHRAGAKPGGAGRRGGSVRSGGRLLAEVGEGFPERREARKYASGLLKAGLIRHTVNKITFSEQCYYVFGDLSGGCESCECPCPGPGRAALAALSCVSSPSPSPETNRGCCGC